MFLLTDTGISDLDLDLLTPILRFLDSQLKVILTEVAECPNADSFGYFDRLESICGLGLVACQTYMTTTYGQARVAKKTALNLGPRHEASGHSIVSLINHGANFWKHKEEWLLKKTGQDQKKGIATNSTSTDLPMKYAGFSYPGAL